MEAGVETASGPKSLGAVIQIDESKMQAHLDEVVRATVEETLNALLDAEADQLCGARKYERTEGRKDTRAGSYDRQLHSKAGEVTLQVPKLRSLPFETAIIERYRRRESSVEEALMEMYLAGVSVRRVEDITQALWGTRVSASTVSDLNQRIYKQIEQWRQQPLVGEFPYVFLDGIWLKRSWGGEVKNVSVLVAIGVAQSGYRQILAVSEGAKEDKASWTAFLRGLKERGLKGGRVVLDNYPSFLPAIQCRLADAVYAAQLPRVESRFRLLQNTHNLFFRVPALLHPFSSSTSNCWPLLSENSHCLWPNRTGAAPKSSQSK